MSLVHWVEELQSTQPYCRDEGPSCCRDKRPLTLLLTAAITLATVTARILARAGVSSVV